MDKERQIKRWEEHLRSSRQNKFYAVQRIDLLIIAISSTGIFISLKAFVADIAHKSYSDYYIFVAEAILFFIASIVYNFISQRTSYLANGFEIKWTIHEIRHLENRDDYNKQIHTSSNKKSKYYNDLTLGFNKLSIWSMYTGILFGFIYIIIIISH